MSDQDRPLSDDDIDVEGGPGRAAENGADVTDADGVDGTDSSDSDTTDADGVDGTDTSDSDGTDSA